MMVLVYITLMKAVARRAEAFTRIELAVVLAIIAALLLMLVPGTLHRTRDMPARIACVNNLRQIGIAYRIWSNDHGDRFPFATPETNGGWRELVYLTNASAYVWTNYMTMANELGLSSIMLICPADERKPANPFSSLANTNISYFVGLGANDTYPQALLGGDRNLGPGTTPDLEYGFSPPGGEGNDVTINGPVCWSLKMHSNGRSPGSGNIMLGDGSAQQVTSGNLNMNWLKPEMQDTKTGAGLTNAAGIRLIFP
jgi:hypothetical protein